MMTPNLFPMVQQTASAFPHLLKINTYEACLEFTQRVLMACGDPAWGHVGKTAGEGQSVPPGFVPRPVVITRPDGQLETITITGVSHDAIFHRPTNQIVDLLGNGSANSDPNPAIHGPAVIQWAEIPQSLNRPNNPWLPAIPVQATNQPQPPTTVPPVNGQGYPDEPTFWKAFSDSMSRIYAEAGRKFPADGDADAFRRFSRCGYDIGRGNDPAKAAEKHLKELRAELGSPNT